MGKQINEFFNVTQHASILNSLVNLFVFEKKIIIVS